MLRINKLSAFVIAAILTFSVITGCGNDDAQDANADNEQAPKEEQQEAPATDEQPVPIVNVDLGMDPKEIVAEYDGNKVTVEEFEDYLEVQAFINPQAGLAINEKDPEAMKMFVETYVGEIMMAEKAPEVQDLEQSAEELVAQIKGQYSMVFGGDEEKVKKQMKDQGVTDEDLKNFLIRYKQVETYLRAEISEDELREEYNKGKEAGAFTTASVRHILIGIETREDAEAKKLADELTARLRGGEDFATLAKEHTEDPGSKETGGLYEDVNINNWVPEFKQAALELPLNEISDPVKTDHGYHIMRVEKRGEQSFDEVKQSMENQFINHKYDEFLEQEVKPAVKNVKLPNAS